MDRWILSRLSDAVESCQRAFENYDFPLATTACYNLWLYDFCDHYLVSSFTLIILMPSFELAGI